MKIRKNNNNKKLRLLIFIVTLLLWKRGYFEGFKNLFFLHCFGIHFLISINVLDNVFIF